VTSDLWEPPIRRFIYIYLDIRRQRWEMLWLNFIVFYQYSPPGKRKFSKTLWFHWFGI
jgi:hypothetical protein